MSNEKNAYQNLLKYLEKQESKIAKEIPKKKKEKTKTQDIKDIKKDDAKDQVRKFTKEMMKETEVFSYVPAHVKKKYPTDGFDVRLFEEKLIKKLIEDHKRLQSYERPYISVSEVLRCLRACYYYRKKYSIDIKKLFTYPYLLLRRKVGDAVHETIQDIYSFDEVEKTVISDKYHVKGRLDGLSDIYIIDFKPTPDYKDKVDQQHYDQGNIYATILNTEYGYSVKKVVIAYYLLNFKDIQVFSNDIDLKRGTEFLRRGKLLKEHLENGRVIDPIGATKKECNFCPYKNYCEKDGFQKVDPPERKIEKQRQQPKKTIKNAKKAKKKIRQKFEYKDPTDGILL